MTFRAGWLVAAALSVLPATPQAGQGAFAALEMPASATLVQGGDLAWREADRARRELQRQQRVAECQNRVLAQQSRYASQAAFLQARQACTGTR